LDRNAVLACHEDAVIASTLNYILTVKATRRGNSLLSLFARDILPTLQSRLFFGHECIFCTSRGASGTKTEAKALDEDVDLTFEDEETRAKSEDIPKIPESASCAAGSLADTPSNKDLFRKEQELVQWAWRVKQSQ
jgi:hypothetical protein